MSAPWSAWVKVQAIARTEARAYVRSLSLWVALGLIVAFTVWTSELAATRTLELFLVRGEALPLLLTAFVLTLLITAGFAREEREAFGDVWNSLPVRNGQQFWGKLLGASCLVLFFGLGLLLLLPIGWLTVGTVWTDATTEIALAYVAQTAGILVFSVGLASVLRGAVVDLRLRYVLGLLIVVVVSVAQALGIDNRALWAVLLSPYMLQSLPYDQSLLFGIWPWETVVLLHLLFQTTFAAILLLIGRILYERRRDPQQKAPGLKITMALLVLGALGSAMLYMNHWSQISAAVGRQLLYDVEPPWTRDTAGQLIRTGNEAGVRVLEYDLRVRMAEDGFLKVTAVLDLAGNPEKAPWPLTLHHQWQVDDVRGSDVTGWRREGNFIWLEMVPDARNGRVIVEYSGRPFLWDWQIGTIHPMHFMGERGGYLSPLLAWYPLPGQRGLVTAVRDLDGRRLWAMPTDEALLQEPVLMRLRWEGPNGLTVVSNLDRVAVGEEGSRTQTRFQGQSDGMAVFVGPFVWLEEGHFTFIGPKPLVYGAETLTKPYDRFMTFLEGLVGRPLPREPVVAVPGWLVRSYNPYGFRLTVATNPTRFIRVLTHMGSKPVVTEQAIAQAIRAAQRWERTQDPKDLLEATSPFSYGLLHSLWDRPSTFRHFGDNGVAFGLVQYTLLRWWEHVAGLEEYAGIRESILEGFLSPYPNDRDVVAQKVLAALIAIEQRHGSQAVRALLGSVYDYAATQPITEEVFEQLAAEITPLDIPRTIGRSAQ